VHEEVDHDRPRLSAVDDGSHAENLTSQEPVQEGDGVLALVVARDSDINVAEGRVNVAEGNDGDVDITGLLDGLVVNMGVSDDDETGLLVSTSGVVREGTGGITSTNVGRASVLSEFEDSALAELTGRDGNDVLRVLDGNDDAGSEGQFLPGHAKVNDVNTITTAAPDIANHVGVLVLGADVDVGGQHQLEVGFLECERVSHGV